MAEVAAAGGGMTFMQALFPLTAGISGITNGIDDAVNGNKLRKSICAANKSINEASAAFKKLAAGEAEEEGKLQEMFQSNIEKIKEHHDDIKIARENFIKTRNTMIISSMLFIISIIISLAFKAFGVFDLVYKALFGKK